MKTMREACEEIDKLEQEHLEVRTLLDIRDRWRQQDKELIVRMTAQYVFVLAIWSGLAGIVVGFVLGRLIWQ